MTCMYPLTAYQNIIDGEKNISFKKIDGHQNNILTIACGQCIECRIARSKSWALRIMHEAQLYEDNCFVTLTYNDESVSDLYSLEKRDMVLFLKRLRKKFSNKKIRFFQCGEYGEKYGRPHHHIILFNLDFPDKKIIKVESGYRLYESNILTELWGNGNCIIGDLTMESAAYVARYCIKKATGKDSQNKNIRVDHQTGEIFEIEPEYITMSRKPGIAREWYKQFKEDIYSKDFIADKQKKFKPPKYYDKIYELEYPDKYKKLKEIRLKNLKKTINIRPSRLSMRQRVAESKIQALTRRLEQ